jgi:hypothetical protein
MYDGLLVRRFSAGQRRTRSPSYVALHSCFGMMSANVRRTSSPSKYRRGLASFGYFADIFDTNDSNEMKQSP